MDMKFEVAVIPVSDVDRARDFYRGLGWRLEAGFSPGPDFRVVQLTPPGSQCSIVQLVRPGDHYSPAGPVRPMPATYDSAAELAEALRRAATANGTSA